MRSFGSAEDPLSSFAFQPSTGRLAAIGKDNAIRFWDVKTGQEVQRIAAARQGETLRILRFLDGGRHCALSVCENKAETDFLSIVDVKDGRELRRLKLRENRWAAAPIALSADGRTVATANAFREACVRVWDVPSGVERLADAGHRTGAILSLSADDRTLISRGYQGRIIHWDLRTGNGQIKPADAKQEDGQPSETAEEWSLRGPRWRLVLHRKTSEMEVRSRDGSQLLRKVKWTPARWWNCLLSRDGTHVAVSIHDDDNVVLLWDPEREIESRKLVELPADLYRHNLLFSHDSKRLIVGAGFYNKSQPNVLWVWDVATAKVVRKLPIQSIPEHLILSGDDRLLIVGSGWADATVHVWDMETGKEITTLTDPSLPPMQHGKEEWDRNIAGLQLSADERFLAVVTHRGDSTGISVWDTAAWKPVRAFPWTRFQNNPHSMTFSRDGRSLFVSNSDSTILEWDVSGRWANGRRPPVGENLNSDRLNILWRILRQTPAKSYPAVWELLDHPDEAVPFLIGKLAPVKPIEAKTVRRWLAQLDSESYAEREEANRQLLMLGEQTLPALRQALQEKPSLETKKRVEGLIDSLVRAPGAEHLRLLRALAVLEWSKRPEAAAHLRRLAAGAPSASLMQAAKAAHQRLQKKALGGS